MQFIDVQKQYQAYKSEIDSVIQRVLDHGRFILGPEISSLEESLSHYVGVKHCISVGSGTDALLVSLLGLGVGPGDEVITVPLTWIATMEQVRAVGATPVLVDIDPDTLMIDVAKVREKITPRTKAIIPVSLFGQMPDMTALNEIAAEHGIAVIEDGAQSFGATHHMNRSCGASLIGVTSFFPTKTLSCFGDGGAVFTNDDELAQKMRAIRIHGQTERLHHEYIGRNARMDTLQAAIVEVKLKHFPDELQARKALGERYNQKLNGLVKTPHVLEGNTHAYSLYTIRSSTRDRLQEGLKEQGVPTAVYYSKPCHLQPAYLDLGYKEGDFPETEKACEEVLSLPIHPWLSCEDQDRVVEAIAQVMEREPQCL